MKNNQFTPRHQKLITLKDDIDVLRLGQKNKEYIQMIEELRARVVEELRIEQAKIGLVRKQKNKEASNG